ncbi:MAG: mechanosensitive ion channel [Proteobacteria bacterium]|nr:MAG: mechanosensitive ion channel [Pseudomonadota bacterium]
MSLENDTSKAWDILSTKLSSWTATAVAMLPNLLVATLVMLGFWLASRLVSKVVRNLLSHTSESPTVTRLIVTFARMFILFFGLFTTLGILNLDKTVASLLAGAGVIGLAIGFAFQEIAANFFSGILIALRKPFREDDIVQVDSYFGTVSQITLRTTNLRSPDGLEILIPNKDMFTKAVTNYTRTPDRRVDLEVGVSYGDDLRKVEKVVRDAVDKIPGRLPNKEIDFFFKAFGDSSITFQVRIWIDFHKQTDYLSALHNMIVAIKEAFDANDISIPFPIRTLDFGIKGGVTLTDSMTFSSQNKNPQDSPDAAQST